MGLTDQYEHLLATLLPRGPAWDNDDPLLLGLAPSLAVAHQRADDLMRETDPRTATELIDRYESITGLPDSCAPAGIQTLAQRRQRLDAKINLAGGINEAFYLAQLSALGYPDATITRYQKSQFTCNSRCTDSLYSNEWRYYWLVNIPVSAQVIPMTCIDTCISPLNHWGDTVAECVLTKLAPSHTYVIFRYTE
ncbi:YmfQ family protein [Dickeya solani]|uniref:YmfQ family protein n=1 Tax=Dickeya solani TaxID=1089444 RepID=A0ABU4EHC0_9GAMM|nr:YmfQ family protein [Dickeya solani]MCZ0823720.1 YmfQ family protein [Dickeya solani]MDV6995627.1 YmfQ family protein [Dickeya solani]MDV7002906.1 YmfQ family protein [Dickeya solani]MDV7036682.1 YmfQ family protein [Dickeya solani]MDV7043435.1 YmfQ family protein [Dickeya solani]